MADSKSDSYALEIIRAGNDLGITRTGIIIGLAACMVEVGYPLKMYANAKVPESLKLPHDAIGSDGFSVGIFQQQIVKTSQGYWWADAATCMDPYKSATLFFGRLKRLDYNSSSDPKVMGSVAQAVQGSAFPDRYAQRVSDAQKLYDRLAGGAVASWYDKDRSAEFDFGGSRNVKNLVGVCVHTTESAPGASADDVTTYQVNTRTGSYNVMVGQDGTRILQNTDNWSVWATGNKGNDILLHLCFVGTASWSRAQWLSQDRMLRAGATVVRRWCDLYGFPVRKVTAASLPGILGHVDTRVWASTDHTDPGPNFPYDVLVKYVNEGSGKAPVENLINKEAAVAAGWLGKRVDVNEIPTPDKRGVFSAWEKGSVYYRWGAPAAYAVPRGGIFEAWAERKWEQGECGFPIARHEVLSWGGRQAFEGGTLYVPFGAPGGFLVHGAIKAAYDDSGASMGPYGLPTSDEYAADAFGKGCIAQDFANVTLIFSPRGVVSVKH